MSSVAPPFVSVVFDGAVTSPVVVPVAAAAFAPAAAGSADVVFAVDASTDDVVPAVAEAADSSGAAVSGADSVVVVGVPAGL